MSPQSRPFGTRRLRRLKPDSRQEEASLIAAMLKGQTEGQSERQRAGTERWRLEARTSWPIRAAVDKQGEPCSTGASGSGSTVSPVFVCRLTLTA